MHLVYRTLANVFASVIPWHESRTTRSPTPTGSSSSKRPESTTQLSLACSKTFVSIFHCIDGDTQRTSRLDTLNADVFRMIALELKGKKRALHHLASCSRTLRNQVAPILFFKCRTVRGKEPPLYIQSYVR